MVLPSRPSMVRAVWHQFSEVVAVDGHDDDLDVVHAELLGMVLDGLGTSLRPGPRPR